MFAIRFVCLQQDTEDASMSDVTGDTLVLPGGSISTDVDSVIAPIRSTNRDSIRSAKSLSVFRDQNASQTMPRSEELTLNLCYNITESASDLESVLSSVKSANHGSVRSVKSLSMFKNQDAPQTMPRSEELTLSLYEVDPSNTSLLALRNKRNQHVRELDKHNIRNPSQKLDGKRQTSSEVKSSTPGAPRDNPRYHGEMNTRKLPTGEPSDTKQDSILVDRKTQQDNQQSLAIVELERSDDRRKEQLPVGMSNASSATVLNEEKATDKHIMERGIIGEKASCVTNIDEVGKLEFGDAANEGQNLISASDKDSHSTLHNESDSTHHHIKAVMAAIPPLAKGTGEQQPGDSELLVDDAVRITHSLSETQVSDSNCRNTVEQSKVEIMCKCPAECTFHNSANETLDASHTKSLDMKLSDSSVHKMSEMKYYRNELNMESSSHYNLHFAADSELQAAQIGFNENHCTPPIAVSTDVIVRSSRDLNSSSPLNNPSNKINSQTEIANRTNDSNFTAENNCSAIVEAQTNETVEMSWSAPRPAGGRSAVNSWEYDDECRLSKEELVEKANSPLRPSPKTNHGEAGTPGISTKPLSIVDCNKTTEVTSNAEYKWNMREVAPPAFNEGYPAEQTNHVKSHTKPRQTHTLRRFSSVASSSDLTPSIYSTSSADQLSPSVNINRLSRQPSQSSSDEISTDKEQQTSHGRQFTVGRARIKHISSQTNDDVNGRSPLSFYRQSLTPQPDAYRTSLKSPSNKQESDAELPLLGFSQFQAALDPLSHQPSGRTVRHTSTAFRREHPIGKTAGEQTDTQKTHRTPLTVDVQLPDNNRFTNSRAVSARSVPQFNVSQIPRSPAKISSVNFASKQTPVTIDFQLPQNQHLHTQPAYRSRSGLQSRFTGSRKHKPMDVLTHDTENRRPYSKLNVHRSMPSLYDVDADIDLIPSRFHAFNTPSDLQQSDRSRKTRHGDHTGVTRQRDHGVHSYVTGDADNNDMTNSQLRPNQITVDNFRRYPSDKLAAEYEGQSNAYRLKDAGGNGKPRSRRTWRTDDMPATDIEDYYETDNDGNYEHSWLPGNMPRRRRAHLAHIFVDDREQPKRVIRRDASEEMLSVISEPSYRRQPEYVSLRSYQPPVIEYRQSVIPTTILDSATLDLPKYQHIDTTVKLLSPEVPTSPDQSIAALDPELKDARKTGTSYNITLTLKPIMTSGGIGFEQQIETGNTILTSSASPLNSLQQSQTVWTSAPSSASYQPNEYQSSKMYASATVEQERPTTSSSVVEIRSGFNTVASSERQLGQIGFDIEIESVSGSDLSDETPSHRQSQIRVTNRKPMQLKSRTENCEIEPLFEVPLCTTLGINYNPTASTNLTEYTSQNLVESTKRRKVCFIRVQSPLFEVH
jgi:hypothetical protein